MKRQLVTVCKIWPSNNSRVRAYEMLPNGTLPVLHQLHILWWSCYCSCHQCIEPLQRWSVMQIEMHYIILCYVMLFILSYLIYVMLCYIMLCYIILYYIILYYIILITGYGIYVRVNVFRISMSGPVKQQRWPHNLLTINSSFHKWIADYIDLL